jgi:DNA mismatch repair protein MutH
MERSVALERLRKLIGHDLVSMAKELGITIWKSPGKKNKGWAGHVLERYLGLPLNSAQSPNFGSWELKVIPLKRNRHGILKVKETMAITMIDHYNVRNTPFENSHLLAKLQKIVLCARVFESQDEKISRLVLVAEFDLEGSEHLAQIKEDYALVRSTIIEQGFGALSGRMGTLIQPRTKGPGHGSISRAFYARASFLAKILDK